MKKVITYGTFDLFHQGHYNLLKRAKELGTHLTVGITSDYFNKCRGKFNVNDSIMQRIKNVESTGFADEIVIEEYFGQKIDDIKHKNIDIFAIGSDWDGHFDYLKEYCDVVYLERTKGISSTELRNRNRIRLGICGNEPILSRMLDELRYVSGFSLNGIIPSNHSTNLLTPVECPVFDDYDSLLENCDAVYINAPLKNRSLLIEQALRKKKHVLTEFPFCTSENTAKRLLDLSISQNVVLMEGLKTAYCPAFGKLVSLARSGLIGNILEVTANFTQILENLDEQIRLTGGSMESLSAYPLLAFSKLFGTDFKDARFYTHIDKKGLDLYTKIFLTFKESIASGTVAIQGKCEGNLIIAGTKGYIYVPAPWWKTEYFEVRYEDINKNNAYFYKFEGEGLRYEVVEFLRSIRENRIDNLLLTHDEMYSEAKILDMFLKMRHSTKF